MAKRVARWLAVVVALASAAVGASAVSAEERTCRGTLGGITVDNLRVPDGATCTLYGTQVQGTIKVETNAILRAHRITVIGNIQAEDARTVTVDRQSRVGGSIQIVQSGSASILDTHVNADILFDDNTGRLVARRNTIGGNLQAFQNTGGVTIAGNTIDGNLQCKENNPPPTGGNNVVHGNKEDQCARL
jgi:hypothetical protein